MNSYGPDERLSAFYDGELSAVERADVERLLAELPNLRVEFSTLSDLSQRLGNLADAIPEADLCPRILQQIVSTHSATRTTPVRSQRRWMPFLLTACALTLVVAAILPLLPGSKSINSLAINESTNRAKTDSSRSAALSPRPAALESESVEVFDSPAIPSSPVVMAAKAIESPQNAPQGDEPSLDGNGVDAQTSALLTRFAKDGELQPGQIISQVVEGGESPMLMEYTVINVHRTAALLEVLLRKHGIIPLIPSSELADQSAGSDVIDRSTMSKTASDLVVFTVDADPGPLNNVMFECQNLQDVVLTNAEPLDLYETPAAHTASRKAELQSDSDSLPAPGSAAGGSPVEAAPPAPAGVRDDATEPAGIADQVVDDEHMIAQKKKSRASGEKFKDSPSRAHTMASQESATEDLVVTQVFGNSLVMKNGTELYAELQQRQTQLNMNSSRGNTAKQQVLGSEPFSRPLQKDAAAVDQIFGKDQAPQAVGGFQSNGLQYNQSMNSARSRQRMILVLRHQTPPPPAPSRISP